MIPWLGAPLLAILLWGLTVCHSFSPTPSSLHSGRRTNHHHHDTVGRYSNTLLNVFQVVSFGRNDPILDSPQWPAVKEALNKVPVFACMNKDEKVLAIHNFKDDFKSDFISMYYVNNNDAVKELQGMIDELPKGVAVRPEGLGNAFEQVRKGSAVIVPSRQALLSAGCSKREANKPWNQNVPLFGLLYAKGVNIGNDSVTEAMTGKSLVPMYLEESTARQAISDMIQGSPEARQIVSKRMEKNGGAPAYDLLSLQGIVKELCAEKPSRYFQSRFPVIIAPSDSYRAAKEAMKDEAMSAIGKNPLAQAARFLGVEVTVDFGDGEEESLK